MKIYARMVDGVAIDVITTLPAETFVEELAKQCIEVPEGTKSGDRFDGNVWTPAPAPVASAPKPPTVGPNQFYFLWTIPEQVALDSLRETDVPIKLFMRRLDDPRTTEVVLSDPTVQAMIAHTVDKLVEANVIAAADKDARIAAIIAGPAQ